MKQLYTLILASLTLCGCTSSTVDPNSKAICDLSMQNEVSVNTALSSILGQPEIIPLSSQNGGMIGDINKIIEHDGDFYVLSNFRRINKFDRDGNCVFELFKVGAGKGEYSSIYDFDVDGDNLLVVTRTEKVIVYNSKDGSYKSDIILDFPCSSLKVCAGKLLCEAIPKGATVVMCDMDGHRLADFGNNTNNPPVMSPVPFVNIDNQTVAYTIFDNNNILRIDAKEGTSTDNFIISMADVLTTQIYKELVDKYGKKNEFGLMDVGDELNNYYCISAFRRSKENILVTFYKGDDNYIGLSNVRTGRNTVYDVSKVDDDIFNSDMVKLIDNIYFCIGNSTVLTYIQPLGINSNAMKSKYSKSIEDGNPILMIFRNID